MLRLLQKLILQPRADKIFLCLLAIAYLAYAVASGHVLNPWLSVPSDTITEHSVDTNPNIAIQYWTTANMSSATDGDQLIGQAIDFHSRVATQAQPKQASKKGSHQIVGSLLIPYRPSGKSFLPVPLDKTMSVLELRS